MTEEEKLPLTANNGKNSQHNEINEVTSDEATKPTIIDDDTVYEDIPVFVECPYCGERIVSKTQFESGKWTYWTTACLCIFQCYCCCWIPFLLDGLKDVIHTCPKCNEKLGEYKRINVLKDWKRKREQDKK